MSRILIAWSLNLKKVRKKQQEAGSTQNASTTDSMSAGRKE
jgi:hypothetical protein